MVAICDRPQRYMSGRPEAEGEVGRRTSAGQAALGKLLSHLGLLVVRPGIRDEES